jgi:hypothetical protein
MGKTVDKILHGIRPLEEIKKVKLAPGKKISSRAFKKMKAAAKIEKTKRSEIKASKKVVIPKTKTPDIGIGDEKHPLEWILKNSGKAVRSKLVTQVHPADRGRVQGILVNDPDGVHKFMSGKVPFRRIA